MEGKRSSMLNGLLNRDAGSGDGRSENPDSRPDSRGAVMLDIRKADGRIVSFNYAYFTRLDYEPGDKLVLTFGATKVRVEGRCLDKLRQSLAEHRRRFIQEETEAGEGLKAEHMECVEAIEIQEGEDK